MRLLLLSNGHGEDAIGAALAPHLAEAGFQLEALPIVGEGHAYRKLGLPIVGPTRAMPSGGFIYGRPAALAGDLQGGLPALTRAQIRTIRRGHWDGVVAVGDIVVLLFAWLLTQHWTMPLRRSRPRSCREAERPPRRSRRNTARARRSR